MVITSSSVNSQFFNQNYEKKNHKVMNVCTQKKIPQVKRIQGGKESNITQKYRDNHWDPHV